MNPVESIKKLSKTGWLYLPFTLVFILLDQLSKSLMTLVLSHRQSAVISDFFSFTLVHNPGAAFSFLADAGGWQKLFFILFSSSVSVFLCIWLLRLNAKENKLLCFALSLVLSGAIGNLIDRVAFGYVVDFLDFHWQGYYWPVFNLADVWISSGVFFLLVDSWKNRNKPEPKPK